jgi:hypothetical protein
MRQTADFSLCKQEEIKQCRHHLNFTNIRFLYSTAEAIIKKVLKEYALI